MKGLLADCRHALRLYRRTPGASLTAVVVLAVGLAFVGAFLSLYVDLILRPHPGFERSNQLATVGQNGGPQLRGVPFGLAERMAEEMASVEGVAAAFSFTVQLGEERESTSLEAVSGQFFDGLPTARARQGVPSRGGLARRGAGRRDLVSAVADQVRRQGRRHRHGDRHHPRSGPALVGGGVSPPAVMLAVVAGLTALLVVATLGPAGEARRTQPAPMLRED